MCFNFFFKQVNIQFGRTSPQRKFYTIAKMGKFMPSHPKSLLAETITGLFTYIYINLALKNFGVCVCVCVCVR